VHWTELLYLACIDTKRTTSTLLKEAIYQILVCHPSPVLKHKALEILAECASGTAKLSLEDLKSLMRELVDTFPSGASGVLNRRIFLANPQTKPVIQRNQYSGLSTELMNVHSAIVKEPRSCMTLQNYSTILLVDQTAG